MLRKRKVLLLILFVLSFFPSTSYFMRQKRTGPWNLHFLSVIRGDRKRIGIDPDPKNVLSIFVAEDAIARDDFDPEEVNSFDTYGFTPIYNVICRSDDHMIKVRAEMLEIFLSIEGVNVASIIKHRGEGDSKFWYESILDVLYGHMEPELIEAILIVCDHYESKDLIDLRNALNSLLLYARGELLPNYHFNNSDNLSKMVNKWILGRSFDAPFDSFMDNSKYWSKERNKLVRKKYPEFIKRIDEILELRRKKRKK